jgi:hypothetical protein
MRSDLQQAPSDSDGDRMGPIVGPQLVHEVLDVEVNSSLGNCQLIGNLLVAVAISDGPEHLQPLVPP